MILHIHTSWTIFTGLSRDVFDACFIPGTHLILQGEQTEMNHHSDFRFVEFRSPAYTQFLIQKLKNYRLVLFHGLFRPNLDCLKEIQAIQNHPPIAWVIYGAEIEDSFIIPSAFLDRRTRVAYYRLLPYRIFIPLFRIRHRIKGLHLAKLIRDVDFFAHFMTEEVKFVEEETGVKKPMLWHSYTMLEDFIGPTMASERCSDSGHLLIGNSASFSSNQLEIMHLLNCRGSARTRVVVPLGYGNPTYRKWLVKKGSRLLGTGFEPVEKLLSKEDYNRLLLDCSVLIINSYKQQALGNIITAAWIGMRIYLRKNTSTFRYLKRKGIVVSSIEDDFNPTDIACYSRISESAMAQNRKILAEIFSREAMTEKLREAFRPYF